MRSYGEARALLRGRQLMEHTPQQQPIPVQALSYETVAGEAPLRAVRRALAIVGLVLALAGLARTTLDSLSMMGIGSVSLTYSRGRDVLWMFFTPGMMLLNWGLYLLLLIGAVLALRGSAGSMRLLR